MHLRSRTNNCSRPKLFAKFIYEVYKEPKSVDNRYSVLESSGHGNIDITVKRTPSIMPNKHSGHSNNIISSSIDAWNSKLYSSDPFSSAKFSREHQSLWFCKLHHLHYDLLLILYYSRDFILWFQQISQVFATFHILEHDVLGRASAQLRSRIWSVAFCYWRRA